MQDPDTPLIYANGTEFFERLSKRYRRHDHGLFILAPSGVGKSHFIKAQAENDWVDGDALWLSANAQPNNDWWTAGDAAPSLREIDARSDVITWQAKKLGYWVMGASNLWLRPDAVVLPDWETHKSQIAKRSADDFHGANDTRLQQLLDHRARVEQQAKAGFSGFRSIDGNEAPVPIYESVQEAVETLTAP
jgi:hypothetical protein